MLRAPDIPVPALGFPSYAQIQRRHNCWLQGSKNSIKRVRELVRVKTFSSGLDPETAFVFGNKQDGDGLPFVGNGEDEGPLILGMTSLKLMHGLLGSSGKRTVLDIPSRCFL
ncbi:hypothetical protein L915_17285 [Phytophthora nicotianae]|uniref:Uncharacterized protein n=1 Tax=Phytophthora nicotianae TaxID=4792 RepID=W2G247_PHYNI|nr:hypothetical protein L915_17285 [Phytophthora nicotianae]